MPPLRGVDPPHQPAARVVRQIRVRDNAVSLLVESREDPGLLLTTAGAKQRQL